MKPEPISERLSLRVLVALPKVGSHQVMSVLIEKADAASLSNRREMEGGMYIHVEGGGGIRIYMVQSTGELG